MAAERILRRLGTIRVRTTIAACLVVSVALALGSAILLSVLGDSLRANLDRTARTRAREVAAIVEDAPTTEEITLGPAGDEGALVQVVNARGRVVAASANVEGKGRMSTVRPERTSRPESRTLRKLAIADHEDVRLIALRPVAGPRGEHIVYVAANLEPVYESVNTVRRTLLTGLPLLLVVLGGITWVIVGRALRPVEAIRSQVAGFSDQDLSRRVPEPKIDDEVGRLATTMNAMLDRLQRFAERQRAFVADASHELQSPIASSRAELEVAAAHPATTDWPATAAELLDDNQRMERLVQDLLYLVRADDRTAVAPHAPVDLDDVVLTEVARLRGRARAEIVASDVAAIEVSGRAEELRRVVRNLLENADRHARSRVSVELHNSDDTAVIVVADDGPGVPPTDRQRIFERFTRLDDSRSRATGGVGLGLAIAKEIVEQHRGTIAVEASSNGSGARFVVRLPVRH
jgi:signal transduction histidine kinase